MSDLNGSAVLNGSTASGQVNLLGWILWRCVSLPSGARCQDSAAFPEPISGDGGET